MQVVARGADGERAPHVPSRRMAVSTRSTDFRALFGVGLMVLITLPCAPQDAGIVVPGDRRVDGTRVLPYHKQYQVYSVRSSAEARATVEATGTLTESVKLVPFRGDTALLYVRARNLGEPGRQVDTIILARHSLTPLVWRTWYPPGTYFGGATFDGRKVSYSGVNTGEPIDTVLPRLGFFEETETLLVPLLYSQMRVLPVRVSTVGFYDVEQFFTANEVTFDVVRPPPPPAVGDTVGIVVVRLGGTRYWLRRGSNEIVQWEEPPGEGGFGLRFVLKGQ